MTERGGPDGQHGRWGHRRLVPALALVLSTVVLGPVAGPDRAQGQTQGLSFFLAPLGGLVGTKITFNGTGCPHNGGTLRDGVFGLQQGTTTFSADFVAGSFSGSLSTAGLAPGIYTSFVRCESTGAVAIGTPVVLTGLTPTTSTAPPSTTTTTQAQQAAVAGSTWYADGSNAKSGPPGTVLRAYAVGAFENLGYRLMLGTGDAGRACTTTVAVLNPNLRFANTSGFIATTVGTVGPGTPPGTYKLCFEDSSSGNFTGTGGSTFTVLAPTP